MIGILGRLAGFAVIAVIAWFAWFVLAVPAPLSPTVRTDGIVVLTGGPGRVARGIELMQAKAAKRMLISGVDPVVRPVELAVEYEVPKALFDCCVDLGRESVDTRSNGAETARWVKQKKMRSVRLVTTDWHMPRARFELSQQLGEEVEVLSDAVESNPSFRALFTEYNKYLLRRAAVIVGI